MLLFPVPERPEGHHGRGDGQHQRDIPDVPAVGNHAAATAPTKKTAAMIA